MDYLEEKLAALDARRGRENVDTIERYCTQHQLFDDIYCMTSTCSPRRRGSIFWVLAKAVYNRTWSPTERVLEELVQRLDEETDVMSKRCIVDIFQYAPLPEEQLGSLTDICIRLIRDPKETIAVRAFSISVLLRVLKRYPELYGEIKDVIEELAERAEPAIQVRAKRAIRSMEKIS